jgi:hypothetical protein
VVARFNASSDRAREKRLRFSAIFPFVRSPTPGTPTPAVAADHPQPPTLGDAVKAAIDGAATPQVYATLNGEVL